MTGSRIALRRYSNCNLHARTPLLPRDRNRRLYDPPPWYNRLKLYIPEEQARPGSPRKGRDKHGPYVWMSTDCLWEWLATRPGLYGRRLGRAFDALHDHVHTPHREPRVNVALVLQRMLVRATRSPELDERLATGVYPDAHVYRIGVRFSVPLSVHQQHVILDSVTDPSIITTVYGRASGSSVTWTERASNSTHARERAQARLSELKIELGGTFWETPVRVKEKTLA